MYIVHRKCYDLFVVINYCFLAIILPKAVNKQHPSNEELLSMTEFFKGELLGFDHLPRYHLVSDVFLQNWSCDVLFKNTLTGNNV